MSELRSSHGSSEADKKPVLEVIQGEGRQGPMGSFFDPIPNAEVAEQLTTFRSVQQREILGAPTIESVLLLTLDKLGYMPEVPIFEMLEDESEESKVARTVSHREQVEKVGKYWADQREIINLATMYYKDEYWQDYDQKKGQDTDRLDTLYNATDPLLERSEFLQVLMTVQAQNPQNQNVIDAQRVARILLLNDCEPIDAPLP